jgi:hypothetical protein
MLEILGKCEIMIASPSGNRILRNVLRREMPLPQIGPIHSVMFGDEWTQYVFKLKAMISEVLKLWVIT